jgi:hypothetical protein
VRVALEAVMAATVFGLVGLFGVALGWKERGEGMRDEATRVGVAEYYLDADHNRQFRWLTNRTEAK